MGTLISGLVWLFVVLPIKLLLLCLNLVLIWPIKLVVAGGRLVAVPFKLLAGLGRLLMLPFKALWWLIMLPLRVLSAPLRLVF